MSDYDTIAEAIRKLLLKRLSEKDSLSFAILCLRVLVKDDKLDRLLFAGEK